MKKIYAVWEREVNSYFTSPIAYVSISVFLILFGWFFYNSVIWYTQMSMQAMTSSPFLQGQLNIDRMVVRPIFSATSIIVLILTPAMTMRLFAEERRLGAFELIYTSPIDKLEWVLGKFAAAATLFFAFLALTVYVPFILLTYGEPDLWALLSSYLGVFLMGLAFISFGLFASSLTENQIIAAVITGGGLLFLWLLVLAGSVIEGAWGEVLLYISVIEHFNDFNNGIIDSRHLIYYATFIIFFLTATVKVLDSQSWR
ncbi:MAG: hypothetical protein B6244_06650 [Candidatus Cloacimonetes bacterium 4572_55]|nr:MAG: hypothetical protein B6244_06650 [Candidatus Cloacimonetes bacterium 4572_55]